MTPEARELAFPVSVIIVTRDRPEALDACLRSVLPQLVGASEIVIVAGNESSCPPELIESLNTDYQVVLASCPEPNICVARNIGLDAAAHQCVLFIDDDAIAHPGWVDAYREAFRDHPDACIAGGIVFDARTKPPVPEFAFGLIHPSGRQIEVRPDPNAPTPRGYRKSVKGCNFAIMRDRAPIDARFDQFYRFAFDETDLLMSMYAAGAECVQVHGAIVDHLHAPGMYRADTPMDRDWRTEFASHTRFMRKHSHGTDRVLGWGVIIARLIKHALRALFAVLTMRCSVRTGFTAVRSAIKGVTAATRSSGTA